MRSKGAGRAYHHANMASGRSRAVIVFTDDNSLAWSGWLARGFRHCFIAIASGSTWVIMDTLSNRMDVRTIPLCPARDLSAWYHHQGYKTIVTRQRTPPEEPAPWAFFTCVEAIKRVLGLHLYRVQTPKQLWNFLKNENSP